MMPAEKRAVRTLHYPRRDRGAPATRMDGPVLQRAGDVRSVVWPGERVIRVLRQPGGNAGRPPTRLPSRTATSTASACRIV